jgi:DedD protein
MEKRKLLLVAISVGAFLVLTIGAAILFFAPRNTAYSAIASYENPGAGRNITVIPPPSYQPPVASHSLSGGTEDPSGQANPQSVDAIDMVRKPNDVPGLQSPPEGAGTVISVRKPSTAAVPDAAPAGRAAAPAAPKPAQAAPAAAPIPAASKPVVASQPKPAAQTKVYDDYWVQTGAFSTVAKAEGVKATLASKGITSIIENRDVNGTTLFRVRVGPYTSQNEANYWLSLIKTIGGFEDSQVRQTQSRR